MNHTKLTSSMRQDISKLHWVWFWSGNWPLLDALTERDRAYEQEFQKLAGTHCEISLDFFEEGHINAYHTQEEYDRMKAFLYRRFEKDPTLLLNSLEDYETKTQKDINTLKKIAQQDTERLSNAKLISLFKLARKHFVYNSAIDHWAWYIEKFFIPKLELYLQKRLKKLNKNNLLTEYLITLVSPTQPSRIYKERLAFYRLLQWTHNQNDFVKKVQSSDNIQMLKNTFPEIQKKVVGHMEQYGYLPVLVNNLPTYIQDIWSELITKTRQGISFDLEVKRLGDNYDRTLLQHKRTLLSELRPDQNTKNLIRALERTAYIRTEDNAVMSQSSFLIIPLYTEIAKRLDISYYELKELAPDEVISALQRNTNIKPLVRSRSMTSSYFVLKGKHYIFNEKDTRDIKRIVEKNIINNAKEARVDFQGTAASLGMAKGKAFVAVSSRIGSFFKTGDILIAPATSADFVPAMRKAGAIVTEFGGLTSHAAVVAREFGIPCIVGVNSITTLIKTGDRIEVDADKGVVRILKKS